jgi:hypothetical protein
MPAHFRINTGRRLPRRTLLRGAGVALALPWMTAMQRVARGDSEEQAPRRFVAMTLGLGLHGANLNPSSAGADYAPSPYLAQLQDLRHRFTVISGTSHPGVSGGHRAEASILSANVLAPVGRGKNSISLDQYMAKHLGNHTRYPSLVLSSSGSNSPSYTEQGAMIPAESSPSRLYMKLFVDDSPAEQLRQSQRLLEGRSIMDLVADDARRLRRELGAGDRDRLDSYAESVRALERRLQDSADWARRPKPTVDMPQPADIVDPNDFIGRQRLMNDMVRLALQTDSTRFITYHLGGSGGVIPLPGVDDGYHNLSHHGLDGEKIEQLAIVEEAIVGAWGDFLRDLAATDDHGGNLLEQTSVLLTSNLGNASNHDNRNMPVLVAGGRFRHGQHLAFDQKRNYPLPNLFVNLLQEQGMEVDRFASSTGTMTGLA